MLMFRSARVHCMCDGWLLGAAAAGLVFRGLRLRRRDTRSTE